MLIVKALKFSLRLTFPNCKINKWDIELLYSFQTNPTDFYICKGENMRSETEEQVLWDE